MPPKLTLIQGGRTNPPSSTTPIFSEKSIIPDWDDLSPALQQEIIAATAPPETDEFIFKPNLFLVDPQR